MKLVLSAIRSTPPYAALLASVGDHDWRGGLGLPRAARLPLLAALHEDLQRPALLITDRADHALAAWEELRAWTDDRRLLFAEPSQLFYESEPWSPAIRRDRLVVLTTLLAGRIQDTTPSSDSPIIVTSARALMTKTMPPGDFLRSCQLLRLRAQIRPEVLRRDLLRLGYGLTNTVSQPGECAARGGLIDFWPPASQVPARLEFFGNEIDGIRTFDPGSQRAIQTLESISLTPAREYLSEVPDEESTATKSSSAISEADIARLHPGASTILDYLDRGAIVCIDDFAALAAIAEDHEAQAVQLRDAATRDGGLSQDAPLPYATWSELRDQLAVIDAFALGSGDPDTELQTAHTGPFASLFTHDERFGGRLKPFTSYVARLCSEGNTVIVASRQKARLEDIWKEDALGRQTEMNLGRGPNPQFFDATLREGFALGPLHLLTDSEIFGWERPAARAQPRSIAETPESVYADLRPGDLAVHIDHGIGRYLGLVQRQVDGRSREYLALEYEGGGQLYVPVHQADRITRFVGSEGLEPELDRLGGQEWHEKKGRAKAAVLKVAQEMLDLNAKRAIARGHAFGPDTTWQAELEASFPYVETPDQRKALMEIKQDMERPRPMDRLLCGDVGYGKTELALRAAFKAVTAGKQVALLVPTTVLAQQHYETFLQRLAAFPVTVEMLSRFRSAREQDDILASLVIGGIDIVIGTHRLLSPDVQFKDLGLVIIDEEQRFGVSHKEHLKQLRTEVDVLTLTATPIPRTLYMALTGVRDISTLSTPPEERLPIVTHVGPYSPTLARRAILREIERGGQVFFVHNRVNTIEAMRAHLSQIVPEARVDIGHGQMPEHELAAVMHRFNQGHTDILLSTTIIESGLDIPNANTLIVDRADTFGLAQLYQLRGRVGRGAARAYAYFFRHRKLSPSVDAQQRLEVIAENTELGSGYSIAMRDLEIRGAGELLGTQQHGHIQAVGFHLYTRLLADAVRAIRRSAGAQGESASTGTIDPIRWAHLGQPVSMPITVDLPLAVGLPTDYIPDSELRLRLYRRIADLQDDAEIDALADEFTDRFGPAPDMVRNLLYQVRVKLRAESVGLSAVSWEGGQIVLRFPTGGNGRDAARLRDLGSDIRGGKGAYWCSFGKRADWQERLLSVLRELPTHTPNALRDERSPGGATFSEASAARVAEVRPK